VNYNEEGDNDDDVKESPEENYTAQPKNGTEDDFMEEEEEVEEEDEIEEEEETRPKRRRKQAAATSTKQAATGKQAAATGTCRTSSRSTKFTNSMAEPGQSIRDLLPNGVSAFVNTKSKKSRRRQNDSSDEEDIDGEESVPKNRRKGGRNTKQSPHKSPARRHAQRRRSLQVNELSSDEESDEFLEEESHDNESAAESEEPEEPLKIQRIMASRTETMKRWRELCRGINTSEIDYGSRWFQEKEERDDDDQVYEERFLIKWSDLSYLHASWETQDDMIDQIEGVKTYLSTFFRKSQNGLLFSPDERCDGDYFDPAFIEIDRILEIDVPDSHQGAKLKVELEDTYTSTSFGMIMNKSDPEFENGTGRQFLIKWNNTPYSLASYEFERDLILNDIEYKDKVKDFIKRGNKPTKKQRETFLKQGEQEFRRLCKVFGDDSSLDAARREMAVEKYQREMEEHIYKNGGQLRDYQAEGVAWMVSNYVNQRSSILADEMGLGSKFYEFATADVVSHLAQAYF
jgi:hypothetical protein